MPKKKPNHKKNKATEEDVVMVLGETEDAKGFHVLRARENRIEAGTVHPLEEGVPITSEAVILEPIKHTHHLYHVKPLFKPEEPSKPETIEPKTRSNTKPVQVATKTYRDNYAKIFSRNDKGWLN